MSENVRKVKVQLKIPFVVMIVEVDDIHGMDGKCLNMFRKLRSSYLIHVHDILMSCVVRILLSLVNPSLCFQAYHDHDYEITCNSKKHEIKTK